MKNTVAIVDDRPFFEKALRYGLERGLLGRAELERMASDAPKGLVQIADHFGTAYLRTDLETARVRLINLVSLYLEDCANGDVHAAALSLRDNSFLSHSRGGSEMLKRLHAMPGETGLYARGADPQGQKIFLNERSFAFPLSLIHYRDLVKQCQANQLRIDFAHWLARQLGVPRDDYQDFSAEELMRSALLVLLVGPKKLEMPTRTQFVKLVEAVRKKSFKVRSALLESFLREAAEPFQVLARQAQQDFVMTTLPDLQSSLRSADEILHGEGLGAFFIRDVPEEDVVAYDKLVAQAWVRITRGNADDPAVLATIFLHVATGHPAKPSALLKEAKSIIQAFRQHGFDSPAVLSFIDDHAPFEQRDDLKAMWLEDLQPDAEIHLADNDPQMPDAYMERALRYFKRNCIGTWKAASR